MTRLIWIILVVAATSAVFYLFEREDYSSYTFPLIEDPVEERSVAAKIISGFKEERLDKAIIGGGGLVAGILAEKGEEVLSGATDETRSLLDKAKTKVFEIFKNIIDERVDEIGENIGIDAQKVQFDESLAEAQPIQEAHLENDGGPIIYYSTKIGAPAYFTIENSKENSLAYEADWQDGKKDEGILELKEKIMLSHIWTKRGKYIIEFKISTQNQEKIYPVEIKIF